jgi:hypothetical protein
VPRVLGQDLLGATSPPWDQYLNQALALQCGGLATICSSGERPVNSSGFGPTICSTFLLKLPALPAVNVAEPALVMPGGAGGGP